MRSINHYSNQYLCGGKQERRRSTWSDFKKKKAEEKGWLQRGLFTLQSVNMFTLVTKQHFRCGPPHSYCSHFIATKTKAKRDQGLDPDYTLSKKTNSVQIQTSHLQTPLSLTRSKIVRFCITCLCGWIRRKDTLFNLLYLLILPSDFLLYWFVFAVLAIKPRTSCMLGKYTPELHPQPICCFNLII